MAWGSIKQENEVLKEWKTCSWIRTLLQTLEDNLKCQLSVHGKTTEVGVIAAAAAKVRLQSCQTLLYCMMAYKPQASRFMVSAGIWSAFHISGTAKKYEKSMKEMKYKPTMQTFWLFCITVLAYKPIVLGWERTRRWVAHFLLQQCESEENASKCAQSCRALQAPLDLQPDAHDHWDFQAR